MMWELVGTDIFGVGLSAGKSLAMSEDGNVLAIGQPDQSGGLVRVYDYDPLSKSFNLRSSIQGEQDGEKAGEKVALSSDGLTMAISSYLASSSGVQRGKVRVYNFVGGQYIQKGPEITGVKDEEFLGWGMSLSGDGLMLAIGSHQYNYKSIKDAGRFAIYQFNTSTKEWEQTSRDFNGTQDAEQLGYTLTLSRDGQTLVSGSPFFNYPTASNAGKVKVYHIQ
jgi:WD40 repeat protein